MYYRVFGEQSLLSKFAGKSKSIRTMSLAARLLPFEHSTRFRSMTETVIETESLISVCDSCSNTCLIIKHRCMSLLLLLFCLPPRRSFCLDTITSENADCCWKPVDQWAVCSRWVLNSRYSAAVPCRRRFHSKVLSSKRADVTPGSKWTVTE